MILFCNTFITETKPPIGKGFVFRENLKWSQDGFRLFFIFCIVLVRQFFFIILTYALQYRALRL